MKSTNISYWKQTLKKPTPAFIELLDQEKKYLQKNIKNGGTVLEIGCGEGRNIETLLRITSESIIYGIDGDIDAVEMTRKIFLNNPNVSIIHADATELPFGNNMFDNVVLFDIFHNLDNKKEFALKEIHRTLIDTGALFVSTYAETAYFERHTLYNNLAVTIKEDNPHTGKFVFEGNVVSEQFSLGELKEFGEKAGLTMVDHVKVGDLAYICKYKKK
jgi:ubiquinone/menaquinone biosynthesis C-methylase UbiE